MCKIQKSPKAVRDILLQSVLPKAPNKIIMLEVWSYTLREILHGPKSKTQKKTIVQAAAVEPKKTKPNKYCGEAIKCKKNKQIQQPVTTTVKPQTSK